MAEHKQLRVRADERLDQITPQEALTVAGNTVEGNTELNERPHDRIVLQRADEHMVTRLQQPLDRQIEGGGIAGGQNDMVRVAVVKKCGKLLAQCQRFQPDLLRRRIHAPIDAGTYAVQIVFHLVTDARRLRPRGRGIIQIDHSCLRFFFSLLYHIRGNSQENRQNSAWSNILRDT